MSSIAQVMVRHGHEVCGSDRNYDRGNNAIFFESLRDAGIKIFPQDGSGVTQDCDFVVASTAIEDTVPDMAKARELDINIIHRSQALAGLFNSARGVGVGGTSGKSTVCGMVGNLLAEAGFDPSIINGGRMKNFSDGDSPGNARSGGSDLMVIESDESDGSIVNYHPAISIVTNISRDHKTIEELKELFEIFIGNTRETAILNADCDLVSGLGTSGKNIISFGIDAEADIRAESIELMPFSCGFVCGGTQFNLSVPGMHNVSNALAAIAVGVHLGIDMKTISMGMASFRGIARRFDLIGEKNGVKVIDDFGHNPDKIKATIEALDGLPGRRHLVFQPHGFGPTKFMKDGLIEVFSNYLRAEDVLYMPEIFYAGGTAVRSVSSAEIIDTIAGNGKTAKYFESRDDIVSSVARDVTDGDVVVVMGARDDTLTQFCESILDAI